MTDTALEIADPIEWLQHFFTEFRSLIQNRLPHVRGGIAEAGEIVVAVDLEHIVEQEADVVQGGFVDRHGVLSAGSRPRLEKILQRSNHPVRKRTLDGSGRPRQLQGSDRAVIATT